MSSKLSIIVTGRNDDYDGNFDERLAIALSNNIKSLPDAEFIFVEWNPYLNKPLTCSKLSNILGDRVKYYVVHPKYHERYCTIDGFLEYPAKNVGVRKSSRDFIICTNSDITFAPDLVERLTGSLNEKTVYRATRIDIMLGYKYVQFPLPAKMVLGRSYGLTDASGDFLMLDKGTWNDITGYCEEFPEQRLHKDSFLVHILVNKMKLPVDVIGSMTHWRHPSSWSNGFCRSKVGDPKWDFTKAYYIRNKDTWGLSFTNEINRDGITWLE